MWGVLVRALGAGVRRGLVSSDLQPYGSNPGASLWGYFVHCEMTGQSTKNPL